MAVTSDHVTGDVGAACCGHTKLMTKNVTTNEKERDREKQAIENEGNKETKAFSRLGKMILNKITRKNERLR